MHLPKYDYYTDKSKTVFEFVSDGPKGCIRKMVEYSLIHPNRVYNLGFGDIDESNNQYDDTIVSNNGDAVKILATVVATVYEFTKTFPQAAIFAAGSTQSRTRLYRIGINRYLPEIRAEFVIFGRCRSDSWEEFTTGKHYEAFLLTRKENHKELWLLLQTINRRNKTDG